MKIFKLKILALALMLATLGSCASDESLKEGEKSSSDKNDFVFEEDFNNYVIDGKLTYDRLQIAKAAKTPYSIIYDYTKNKVLIFTTSKVVNDLKSEFVEYNQIWDGNGDPIEKKAVVNYDAERELKSLTSSITNGANSIKTTTASRGTTVINPNYDLNYYASENDSSDFVLHVHYTAGGVEGVYFNADMGTFATLYTNERNVHRSRSDINSGKMELYSLYYTSLFEISAPSYGFSKLINHSTVKKTITLYAAENYGGNSKSIIVAAGGSVNIASSGTNSLRVLATVPGGVTLRAPRSTKVTNG